MARLWHALTLLREHRGDGHIAALVAEGVGGLESHMLLAIDWGSSRRSSAGSTTCRSRSSPRCRRGLQDRGLVDRGRGHLHQRGAGDQGPRRGAHGRARGAGVRRALGERGRGARSPSSSRSPGRSRPPTSRAWLQCVEECARSVVSRTCGGRVRGSRRAARALSRGWPRRVASVGSRRGSGRSSTPARGAAGASPGRCRRERPRPARRRGAPGSATTRRTSGSAMSSPGCDGAEVDGSVRLGPVQPA